MNANRGRSGVRVDRQLKVDFHAFPTLLLFHSGHLPHEGNSKVFERAGRV
jgi:hypothetical protein